MTTGAQDNGPNDLGNVLVVDDEAVIREGMRRILENDGYNVETAAGGKAAMERIRERPFDVVVTDLKMPGMDGLDFLKTIKMLQPDVPVIIITGYATGDMALEVLRNGAFDYIAKPFSPQQISEKVRNASSRRRCSGKTSAS